MKLSICCSILLLTTLCCFPAEECTAQNKIPRTDQSLEAPRQTEVGARVYDRANAPDAVLEILRLSHSGVRPLTLDFSPQKKWPLSELGQTGIPENAIHLRGPDPEETTILAISQDGYLTVRQVLHD